MACGACSNIDQLIGFRAAQGVGGAGLYAMAMITYPEISPPNLVPMLSAILGLIVALAGVSGPIIGGVLATYVNWRWAFWIKYVRFDEPFKRCSFVTDIELAARSVSYPSSRCGLPGHGTSALSAPCRSSTSTFWVGSSLW